MNFIFLYNVPAKIAQSIFETSTKQISVTLLNAELVARRTDGYLINENKVANWKRDIFEQAYSYDEFLFTKIIEIITYHFSKETDSYEVDMKIIFESDDFKALDQEIKDRREKEKEEEIVKIQERKIQTENNQKIEQARNILKAEIDSYKQEIKALKSQLEEYEKDTPSLNERYFINKNYEKIEWDKNKYIEVSKDSCDYYIETEIGNFETEKWIDITANNKTVEVISVDNSYFILP